MKTTLSKIRAHSPCSDGWSKLLGNLGKTKADDEQLAITTVLESNGLDDALWCLRAVDGHQREMRLFAVDCARSVQHLMTASRSIAALDVAELYANGFATAQELAAARVAAWTASRAAASAAASAAVRGTAWTAAWTASSAASRDAASAAVRDAARDTGAWDAAWDASRAVQATLLCIVCAEIEQREQA
jgi:hypothetical protein